VNIKRIQQTLEQTGIDGWLFYDFHNRDPISYRVLGMDFGKFTSRRWFYFIPSNGEPVRLVHRVEPAKLDSLPGKKMYYVSWMALHDSLREILGDRKRIAMQYSQNNNIPYISMADAGTVDLIRGMGHTVVSSADLVQYFEAVIDEAGYRSHIAASRNVYQIKDDAYSWIEIHLKTGKAISEFDVQQYIVQRFRETGMTCDGENPIVGVNAHPANPHFEPTPENSALIHKGDTILIDLWARFDEPDSIWADITWCGYAGLNPPEKYIRLFEIVRTARDTGVDFIKQKFRNGTPCYGWEVDDAVRKVITEAGYGDFFIHRTGHSIGREVHGNGVHIDNLETREERQLIPGICFSIEPGIYLEGEMGVRSEINVFITRDGSVSVEGCPQKELILLNIE
jgi:Xaa-Pro dipeptidase